MQIRNNVQSFNYSTPSFGYVRCSNELLNRLENPATSSPELVDKIVDATKKCANTKYFNIDLSVIDKKLKMTMFSLPDAYFGLFKVPSEKFPQVKHGQSKDILMLGNRYGVHQLGLMDGRHPYSIWDITGDPITSPERINEFADIAIELDKQAVAVAEEESRIASENRKTKVMLQQKVGELRNLLQDK